MKTKTDRIKVTYLFPDWDSREDPRTYLSKAHGRCGRDSAWSALAEAGRDRSLCLLPSPLLGGRLSAAQMKKSAASPLTTGWGCHSCIKTQHRAISHEVRLQARLQGIIHKAYTTIHGGWAASFLSNWVDADPGSLLNPGQRHRSSWSTGASLIAAHGYLYSSPPLQGLYSLLQALLSPILAPSLWC